MKTMQKTKQMKQYIETPRLILRSWKEEDIPQLV